MNEPYSNYPPAYDPAMIAAAARQRVLFPAIFLLVSAALNIAVAVLLAVLGVAYGAVPPDQVQKLEQMMSQQNPQQWEELQRRGYTMNNVLELATRMFFTGGGVTGFAGLLILLGGIRMIQLRSYGLAVFASLLSAIPCISPSGCLMLGVMAGVWSLVVLLDVDVRSSFL